MNPRYVLAPEAARDLIAIWRLVRDESNQKIADRVEFTIRQKIVYSLPGLRAWDIGARISL